MNKTITAVIILMVLGALFLAAPSQEQIQSCVDQTGWSEARCGEELAR